MSNYVSGQGIFTGSVFGDVSPPTPPPSPPTPPSPPGGPGGGGVAPRSDREAKRIAEINYEIARAVARPPYHRDVLEMRDMLNRAGFESLDERARSVFFQYLVLVAANSSGRVNEFAGLSALASRIPVGGAVRRTARLPR